MASLQEQLLKAGLTDEKKVKKANKDKRKQSKVARRSKEEIVDEAKVSAQQARAEKAERDRELNRQRQDEANKKAIAAQIKQLIEMNKVEKGRGDIAYNFTDDKKIKKIYVNEDLQNQLIRGRLAIVKLMINDELHYELVPSGVAEKIALRNDDCIVLINEKSVDEVDEDDPYADYQIPDDLMW
jgi:hypothetical protein